MIITYRGFKGTYNLDKEAEIYHGEVTGFVDVVTFQGKTPEEAVKAFKDSVNDYLTWGSELEGKPQYITLHIDEFNKLLQRNK